MCKFHFKIKQTEIPPAIHHGQIFWTFHYTALSVTQLWDLIGTLEIWEDVKDNDNNDNDNKIKDNDKYDDKASDDNKGISDLRLDSDLISSWVYIGH